MKLWIIFGLFGLLHLGALADDVLALSMQRERLSRQLAELGYHKWVKVQREFMDQLLRVQKAELAATKHRRKTLLLVSEYGELRKLQRQSVELTAEQDLEQAQKLAMEYVETNLRFEEELEKARQKQAKLNELAEKHKGLLQQLDAARKVLRNGIEKNRKQIDQLVAQWQSTSAKLKKLDQKSSQADE